VGAKDRVGMPYGWGRVPYAYADRLPWMNLPFPVEEYYERLQRLGGLMARDGIDCLVVLGNSADGTNIRYLTTSKTSTGERASWSFRRAARRGSPPTR